VCERRIGEAAEVRERRREEAAENKSVWRLRRRRVCGGRRGDCGQEEECATDAGRQGE